MAKPIKYQQVICLDTLKIMSVQNYVHNMRRLPVLLVIGLLLSMSMGCSTAFKLPETEGELEEVFLLSYSTWGHHSLAFYKDSTLVEFTYGDWDLFALNRRDAWTAWKNMTFYTQGALGRKVVTWTPGTPLCPLFKECKNAKSFFAPSSKINKLYNRLQDAYRKQEATEVFNDVAQLYFVKYDVSYWGFHNCNHELADWLEELGAEISGRVFLNPDFIGGMVR